MKGVEHSNNQAARIRPWLMIVLLLSPGWLYGQGQPPLVSTSFSIQTRKRTWLNIWLNFAGRISVFCDGLLSLTLFHHQHSWFSG